MTNVPIVVQPIWASTSTDDRHATGRTSRQLSTGVPTPNDADYAAVAPLIQASADPVEAESKRLRQIEAACRGEWNEAAEQVTN